MHWYLPVQYNIDMSNTLIIKLQQYFAIVAITVIVMWILMVAMIRPQTAYATQDEVNPSPLSSDVDDCASDELPASINGRMQCIRQGECYSEEFDGKEVKHCNTRWRSYILLIQ